LRREIDFEIEQGVDGLVVFGLASEVYKLSEVERLKIIELIISHVAGLIHVIAGTEHTGSDVAAMRSYQAQELGVSGVMLYPPSFVKPDVMGILEYYQLVSDRIKIPLMIQDAQTWTQVPLSTDLLVQMHRDISAVKYVKIETIPTGPKISKVLEASSGSLKVFGGYGGLYYMDELRRGAVGTLIPSALSDAFVAINHVFQSGKVEEAEALHQQLLPFLLFEMTTLDTLIDVQKILFHHAGIFETPFVRKPHMAMDTQQYKRLNWLLQNQHFSIINKYN
jgi:4-hydroxy-tetrahydrodipicolinate synthase